MSGKKYRRAGKAVEPERTKPLALVIENDEELNDRVCDSLTAAGYECVQAFSANEGLEFIKSEEEPALIVIESRLTDISGPQCCAYIKLNPDMNLIPQIMLVDRPAGQLKINAVRVEPDAYVEYGRAAEQIAETARKLRESLQRRKRAGLAYHAVLLLQSNLKFLDKIDIVLNKALQVAKFSEIDEQKIRYVTLEMGHNAIEWGNRNVLDRPVKVTINIESDRFEAKIGDEGQGFDCRNIPHAANASDPLGHMARRKELGLREGGFGIMLAREFMDEVNYNEKGNEVTIVKYLEKKPAPLETPS